MFAFSPSEVGWLRVTWPEYGWWWWRKYGEQKAVVVMVPADEAVKELKARVAMGQPIIDCPLLQGKGGFLDLQCTEE